MTQQNTVDLYEEFEEFCKHEDIQFGQSKTTKENPMFVACGFAAFSGNLSLLKLLNTHGAIQAVFDSVSYNDEIIISLLECAVVSKTDEGFDFFKTRFEEFKEKQKMHFCQFAIWKNQFERLKWLIAEAKFMLNVCLFECAIEVKNQDIITWLFEQKCPHEIDGGRRLFFHALECGDLKVLKVLNTKISMTKTLKNSLFRTLLKLAKEDKKYDIEVWLDKLINSSDDDTSNDSDDFCCLKCEKQEEKQKELIRLMDEMKKLLT